MAPSNQVQRIELRQFPLPAIEREHVPTFGIWSATGSAYREDNPKGPEPRESIIHETLFTLPLARVTWLCAIFALGYVGLEVSLGGWIVTFMLQVRHGEDFASGMTTTGFWAGLALGRVALGLVTQTTSIKKPDGYNGTRAPVGTRDG